ncbi:uncharacterized protein Z519_11591 [Cladophialophora bantiana CBS 173.52]|uniref:Uncharacterized protein n=1 Tax=Cladophialophora bantiana (strain ATCC 10958 / CBS 173.52 / CDC B-1940 / NIH 8579) TaxID=1442370 RepID=A0A0D2FLN2_CLAB1|nr:uncharacterized protein Z519_11591 [Cladophialophora bantiana CBS 173.52]KIW87617.1 hypothetical protein Z519_11591 [Cladophialophora bantiana CBS 173.52]
MTAPSPPTSPTTPSRKRRSLLLSNVEIQSQDATSPSPYTSGTTNGTTYSRRSSRTSQTSYLPRSPLTPRPMSSKSSRPPSFSQQRRPSRTSINSNRSIEHYGDGNGLGNLADELEQAWGEEEEGEGHSNFLDGLREGEVGQDSSMMRDPRSPYEINDMHDFGFGMVLQSPHSQYDGQPPTLRVPQPRPNSQSQESKKPGHQRQESAYDGSDYGPDSEADQEEDVIPPILRKRIRDIENLTRMCVNPEDAVSEGGGTVRRVIHGLKDLGPQANIEYGVTRLITAYTSMASHRTHKTRDLFTQSHSLMYGGTLWQLPEEMIDLLLDDITSLSSTLPFLRPQNPLLSLQILASQTEELSHTLRSLTDLLQESRLAASAATRKLKSVRDMVEDMSLDEELVENSILLIQAGDWDRRCRERQAARTCQEVCEGFADRWGLQCDVDLISLAEGRKQPAPVLVSG